MMSEGQLGLPRYENDDYHRKDGTGYGNYWFIASLWLAQYAQEIGDLEFRDALIHWVASQADRSRMLAEQLHPETSEPLSVSPLVWSHAEFMATMLDVIDGDHR
jgi:glucoamylase